MSSPAFPWLASARRRTRSAQAAQAERRAAMYRAEMTERAGLYYRLGYPAKRAIARLRANLAWDFELAPASRPVGLTEKEIGEIVKAAYQRRPTR